MNENQRRLLVDSRQLWDTWQAAYRQHAGYKGGMTWKTVKGGEYLVRIEESGYGGKRQRSLGPRNAETERLHEEFRAGKQDAKERLAAISTQLDLQARMNKAVDLGRVPTIAAKILRRLDREGLLGRNIIVSGTNAMFAYEAVAGVFVGRDLLATSDLDLMMDARAKLRLTVEGLKPRQLLDVLRSVDRSFERTQRVFQAVNRSGFYVDLIKPEPRPAWSPEPDGFGDDDLQASMIANIKWIENAPKFAAVAIGEDGLPAPMTCPDPRAFALYKLWMGTRDRTRDPVKASRDVAQAEVVAEIVRRYLPLEFRPEHLKFFPKTVTDLAVARDSFFEP